MRVLAAIGLAVVLSACATDEPVPTISSKVAVNVVRWNWETFKAGDQVVISHNKSGTFKPADTGHEEQVLGEGGETGIVLGGIKRLPPLPWMVVDSNEPIQVVLVRWDPQTWTTVTTTPAPGTSETWNIENAIRKTGTVELGAFEASIHAEYLDVVKK